MNLLQQRAHLQAEVEAAQAQRREAARQSEAERLEATRALTPLEHQQQRAAQLQREQQLRDEAAMRETRATIRRRYLSVPGADPEQFERDFPRLLAAHRERVALDGTAPELVDDVPFADPARWGLG